MKDSPDFLPLDGDARRQYINARETFLAARIGALALLDLSGQMFWRSQGGHEYLVRVSKRGSQTGLGRRSPVTEALYASFYAKKSLAKERLDGLTKRLKVHARLNQAFGLNRADSMLIEVLSGVEKAGLGDSLSVIDANALIGYETRAGVRAGDHAKVGNGGLPNGVRKQLILGASGRLEDARLSAALQAVDKSFSIRSSPELWSATNREGYKVVLAGDKRLRAGQNKAQYGDGFWSCDRRDLAWLLSAPIIETVIVGKKGTMARMMTADPRAFVLYNSWVAAQTNFPEDVRREALYHACLAKSLIESYLPNYI